MSNADLVMRRKARKRHLCSECYTFIEPGEQYIDATGVYDRVPYRYRRHFECENWAIVAGLISAVNGDAEEHRPRYGDVANWLREWSLDQWGPGHPMCVPESVTQEIRKRFEGWQGLFLSTGTDG